MEEVAIKVSDLDWDEAVNPHPGTHRKVLLRCSNGEPRTILLKLDPGFEMDGHSHVYPEHHYVLRGEYESQGTIYPAGSYRMIPRHADHGPFRSDDGAVILVMWEVGD